jgi:hypothetical protein
MEHQHAQGKEQTPVTEGTPACNVLLSREAAYGRGNAGVQLEYISYRMMVTRSSLDT